MKVGSLVICIDNSNLDDPSLREKPELNTVIYTVREIVPEGLVIYNNDRSAKATASEAGVYLEEIENPHFIYFGFNYEPPYEARRFREVVPPIVNEIEELLKEPEYVTM